ncbi:DUF397 domain-containing protein [Streptomyces sp. B3I8]|uniref:DUF397 domain-containing protein n=1 Tax=Streptomyces sp. B3I8 TaxID=3042303 RepID=UPI00278B6A9B|nr:DUF397 domain-containing protein [Streptomyces sp. B3I8]MDQ0788453.1 hypothetical protein [Streptomyces sp. B3I8]
MTLAPAPRDGHGPKWIKSGYSGADTPSCVEIAWVKSSYSTDEGPDCVEVAPIRGRILIRDSKNPTGPRLALAPTAWTAFLPYASTH